MPRVIKLTVADLQRIISEEKGKLGPMGDVGKEAKKTKEVQADKYADTLEKDVDHLKAMKVKEAALLQGLKKLREEMKAKAQRVQEAKSTKAKPAVKPSAKKTEQPKADGKKVS